MPQREGKCVARLVGISIHTGNQGIGPQSGGALNGRGLAQVHEPFEIDGNILPRDRGAFGGTLAAPIWSLFAHEAYHRLPVPAAWQLPPGLVPVRVRRRDGALALNDSSDATYTEYFLEGTEPTARGIAQRLWRRIRW